MKSTQYFFIFFIAVIAIQNAYGVSYLNMIRYGSTTCSASSVLSAGFPCENALKEELYTTHWDWVNHEWQPSSTIEGRGAIGAWISVSLSERRSISALGFRQKNSNPKKRLKRIRVQFDDNSSLTREIQLEDVSTWQTIELSAVFENVRKMNVTLVEELFDPPGSPGQPGFTGIRMFTKYKDIETDGGYVCLFPRDEININRFPTLLEYWCTPVSGGDKMCNISSSQRKKCLNTVTLATSCDDAKYQPYGPESVEEAWCQTMGKCFKNPPHQCYVCSPNRYGNTCDERCFCRNPEVGCHEHTGPQAACNCQDHYYKNETAGDHHCLPGEDPSILDLWSEEVNQGQNARVHCQSRGWPVPVLSLQHDGANIIQDSTNFTQSRRSSYFTLTESKNGSSIVCESKNNESTIYRNRVLKAFIQPELKSALEFESVNASTITVKWQPWDDSKGDTGDGPVVRYILHCDTDNPGTMKECLNDTTGITQHTETDLKHHTVYTFAMQLVRPDLGGEGPRGTEYQKKTSCIEPTVPRSVNAIVNSEEYQSTIDSYSCSITWQEPSIINCDSIIHYTVETAFRNGTVYNKNTTTEKEYILYLPSENNYTVTIKCNNDEGLESPWSDPHVVKAPNRPEEEKPSGQSYGWIAGLVIGVGLLSLVVVGGVILYRRGRQPKGQNYSGGTQNVAFDGNRSTISKSNATSNEVYEEFGIPVHELLDCVLKLRKYDNKGYKDEFQRLPDTALLDHDHAVNPKNMNKNRFKNIFAYDETRVKLLDTGDDKSDYINACYINSFNEEKHFIAAQGPTPETVSDFWKMLWEQKTEVLVMLTNTTEQGKTKCEQYWPGPEETRQFKNIVVTNNQSEVNYGNYIIRHFEVTHKFKKLSPEILKLTQMHYTTWPDQRCPPSGAALMALRNVMLDLYTKSKNKSHIVVHCSAGVGRTGTLIGLDYLMDEAHAYKRVDIRKCVENMRKQRMHMVQSLEQYIFIYETLLETTRCGVTLVLTSQMVDVFRELMAQNRDDSCILSAQFQFLTDIQEIPSKEECSLALTAKKKKVPTATLR